MKRVYCINGYHFSQCVNERNDDENLMEKLTSWRWRVAYLTLSGMIIQIAHRNCISLALVCMTEDVEYHEEFTHNASNMSSSKTMKAELSWDSQTQGLILSSFFYGQLISPFLSVCISRRFGVKLPMALYMTLSAILLVALPMSARANSLYVIIIRSVQGFLCSACMPMYSQLWDKWSPVPERSQLMAFTFSGLDLGTLVAFTSSGMICLIPVNNGWPFIFYIFGIISMVWVICWLITLTDDPNDHPWITKSELIYITGNKRQSKSNSQVKQNASVPWVILLTSAPVWAMITAMVTVAYGMTVVFTYLPRYMHDVLHFDISKNGFTSALPFLGRSVSITLIAVITDRIIRMEKFSVTIIRKLNQCISSFLGGITIFFVGYVEPSHSWVAILLVTVSATVLGGTMSGSYTNALELAPRYASIISGIAFTLIALGQIAAPVVTANMTSEGTLENWKHTFMHVGAVYLIGGVIYGCLGSSTTLSRYQNWVELHTDFQSSQTTGESEEDCDKEKPAMYNTDRRDSTKSNCYGIKLTLNTIDTENDGNNSEKRQSHHDGGNVHQVTHI